MGKMTSSEEARALNPIDDLMFRKMAEDVGFCEEILRVILEDNELKVLETIPQWTGTNLQGHSVILDAKCVKSDGRQVNIEVQKEDDDDHQRRVRYNGYLPPISQNPEQNLKMFRMYVLYLSQNLIYLRGRVRYIMLIGL